MTGIVENVAGGVWLASSSVNQLYDNGILRLQD